MHIKRIAGAACSGTTEFCENSGAAAPSTHRLTTTALRYFAPLYRDQRPAILISAQQCTLMWTQCMHVDLCLPVLY